MKKQYKKFEYKPKNTTLLHSLLSEKQWLRLLEGKPYQALIDYLYQYKESPEELDYTRLSIKRVSEELKEKRIVKWLPMIVEDLIDLNWEKPELFRKNENEILYSLHFREKYYDCYFYFNLWLDKPLQVFDRFSWSFTDVKIPSSTFSVEAIDHSYANGKLETTVCLQTGYPDKYRSMLLDRALFENKLGIMDTVNIPDYEIDSFLRTWYK